MSKYTELMLMYSDGELDVKEAFQVEQLLSENKELKSEYVLNHHIDTEMRGFHLMEQIKNETELSDIDSIAKSFISDHLLERSGRGQSIEFYLNGAISHNKELEVQIDNAERDMHLSGIEQETFGWVQNWEEQRLQGAEWDEYTHEIAAFVKSGMNFTEETVSIPFEKLKRKKLIVRLSSIAAVLIIALGLWSVFNIKAKPEELFADYYKPYVVIDGQTRSQEQQVNDKFIEGVKLYRNGNFSESGLIFNELLNADEGSAKIRLLYGISLLEEEKYDQAISNFNEVIAGNGEYFIESKWYLALCYLRLKDINAARKLLKELSVVPGFYQSKSIELLKDL